VAPLARVLVALSWSIWRRREWQVGSAVVLSVGHAVGDWQALAPHAALVGVLLASMAARHAGREAALLVWGVGGCVYSIAAALAARCSRRAQNFNSDKGGPAAPLRRA
jgi:hypothetical protein